MQATPSTTTNTNSSTIKLTKSSTTSVTPTTATTLETNNAYGGPIKLTRSTKTSLSKRTTTLQQPSSLNGDPIASKEIEEISKKISEHADAIYRTWKCRGLAPTEILDFYTNAAIATVNAETNISREAAVDIFGGSVEAAATAAAVGTTEGLQKLVSQFVIKDKEQQQRGAKTIYGNTTTIGSVVNLHKVQRTEEIIIPISSLPTTPTTATSLIMPENIGNKMTPKAVVGTTALGGALKQTTLKTSGAQKSTTISKTATASTTAAATTPTTSSSLSISMKSGISNENIGVKKLTKSTASPKTTSLSTTKSSPTITALSSSSAASSLSPSLSSSSAATSASSSASAIATSLKNNACVKNVNSMPQQQQQQQQQHVNKIGNNNKPTIVTTTTPITTSTKKNALGKGGNAAPTLDINVNLDLDFNDLKLDVNNLTHLQTQNLMKIKELLDENATKEPKKTIQTPTTAAVAAGTTTATTLKPVTKIKRPKSPGKQLDINKETDPPTVTKLKAIKLINASISVSNDETDSPTANKIKTTKLLNNGSNDNSVVKKIAKNPNSAINNCINTTTTNNSTNNNNSITNNKNTKSISVSDKSNNNSIISNSNNCIGVEINDAAINQLISTNSSAQRASGKTSKTPTTTPATTKTKSIKTTTGTKTTSAAEKTSTLTAPVSDITATPTSTPKASIANAVSSVKTVDHQSIKALENNTTGNSCGSAGRSSSSSIISNKSNSNNSSSVKKQPQPISNENVAEQHQATSSEKPTTTILTPIKKVTTKENNNKSNESEKKISNNSNSNSSANNNNIITAAKPQKSGKTPSSSKSTAVIAVAATAAAASTTQSTNPVMEIAPPNDNQVVNNNKNNNNNNTSSSSSNESDNGKSSSNMPAPTKINTGRPATGATQDKLNRPFLTRGSVAERVLMFEKCPGVRNSYLNIKRPDLDVLPRSLQKVSLKLHSTPPGKEQQKEQQNSLQKEIRTTRSVYIPRFYFPHGKPQPQIAQERILRGILAAFDSFPNNQVTKDELPQILKLCGLPFYWRMPVVVFCQQNNNGLVERSRFLEFWKQMNIYCHDAASRFVYIHSRGQRFRSYIAPEDLVPLVQDVVDTHPGLAFLKEATEFHSRYVHTVIARIFYSVNRSWSGKISISELKKSDLLEIITLLEEEDDINQIMAFFSYEHFYVIYCKFWELDKDHDLLINQDDLARHSDHALSTRIVERIFSGCVTRNDNKKHPDDEPKMSYTDFVWFLLSEEDKRTPTAIEYWFRCMDLDGDGVLSMYELEYFYEEQQQRMESIGIETLPFEDCLCQMLDMIKPQRRDAISLGDLKRCRMTQVFFDTFFNLEKYLDHEQRDPFATQRDEYASDWDRFAAHEYELLISEENVNIVEPSHNVKNRNKKKRKNK